MNFELISVIILFISLVGMIVIIFRKIPILVELPETTPTSPSSSWRNIFLTLKNFTPFKGISLEILLQKILSKIRILTLKTDSRTSSWLQGLRERAKKKKFSEEDNYWEKIKKSTKK